MRMFIPSCHFLLALAGLLLLGSLALATAPAKIGFQGRLATTGGENPANPSYAFRFGLYADESGWTDLWIEEQNAQLHDGVFDVILGEVNPLPTAPISSETLYLQVSVYNPATGLWENFSPRFPFHSVAFAKGADTLGGHDSSYFLASSGGQVSGGLSVSGQLHVNSAINGTQKLALWDGEDDFYGLGVRNSGAMAFSVANQEKMTLDAEGRLGLGNTNPAYQLDVVGDAIRMRRSTDSGAEGFILYVNGAENDFRADNADLVLATTSGDMHLETVNGKVGIGTATPEEKLSVAGPVRSTGGLNSASLRLKKYGAATWHITSYTDRNLNFWSTYNRLSIQEDGDVGINTATPGEKLEVNGNMRVDGNMEIRIPGGTSGFPPPAYDSDWVDVLQDSSVTLTHALGGNEDNYLVRIYSRDLDDGLGISNYRIGGDMWYYWDEQRGFHYKNLTNSTIQIVRLRDDNTAEQMRVRIWTYKTQ